MSDLSNPAFSLAMALQALNLNLSWRDIAFMYYGNQVHFATLCRIAKTEGEWLPKDRAILKALGLIEVKRRTKIEKAISRMARQTKKDVLIVNHKKGTDNGK